MTEERWRELIRVEPDAAAVQPCAERARQTALARLDAEATALPPRRGWLLAPAAVAASVLLVMGGHALRDAPQATPEAAVLAPVRSQAQTRVQFVLSDGTRVQWVFDDRFGL